MMRNLIGISTMLALSLLVGCEPGDPGYPPADDPAADTIPPGVQEPRAEDPTGAGAVVRVTLEPTSGHEARGTLTLAETAEGVQVTGQVLGLSPDSRHGFHVHEFGNCDAPDASSAGEHFDPTDQPHGDPRGAAHHVGDMRNLEADADGVAEADHHIVGATLHGEEITNIRSRAIIVHAEEDDHETQPGGDAGDRISCGVVPDWDL